MGFDKVGKLFERGDDRDRAARLHARAHAQPFLRHPRRGAEHHAGADEDVPHAHRLRHQGGGHRRRDPDRPRARPEERPGRGAATSCATVRGIAFTDSPPRTWCATRWCSASSMPTSNTQREPATRVRLSASRARARCSTRRRARAAGGDALPRAGLRGAARGRRASRCASSDEDEGRALNRDYRGKDYATNVLTFVYSARSAAGGRHRAVRAGGRARGACAGRSPLDAHYAHLVVHGVLHLQGYDHEATSRRCGRRMEARESRIHAARLGFADPYQR